VVDAHDALAALHAAALQPAEHDLALVVIEARHRREQLRRAVAVHVRRRDLAEDRIEQRLEGRADVPVVGAGRADERVRVDGLELGLRLRRAEVEEQVEGLVEHVVRPRVRAVDLVHHEDRAVTALERLAQHELRLRHRAIHRVHEQEDAVDHVHHPLDLAAEVGMTGRVDDVDLRSAVDDGRVLGHDRDAALTLEGVAVHDPLGHLLVLAEDVALLEHGVDQRRLAVVDVGDDRDVADVSACCHL
jgi:hypothetical protein